jgi:hypothetical protein
MISLFALFLICQNFLEWCLPGGQVTPTPRMSILHAAKSCQMPYNAKIICPVNKQQTWKATKYCSVCGPREPVLQTRNLDCEITARVKLRLVVCKLLQLQHHCLLVFLRLDQVGFCLGLALRFVHDILALFFYGIVGVLHKFFVSFPEFSSGRQSLKQCFLVAELPHKRD